MDYPQRISCAADDLPKDDIDELFEKLLPIEPPAELIRRILSSVSGLPRPEAENNPLQEKKAENPDSLIVRKDHLPPS
jgi:hypothetical protein